MHDARSAPVVPESERLSVGERVSGVVVCHHGFGLGVRLDGKDEYGHVDAPQIVTPPNRIRGTEDYPPIGATVTAQVLGYSADQLRLTLREE